MNLDQLNTFLAAAETLSFTQAGKVVHLSQPGVSQQIRELETSLGVALFERRGRSILLTPAGERLKPMAAEVLSRVRVISEELAAFRGIEQGVIQIGAENTLGIYLLPHALGIYTQRHPGVRLSLRVADAEVVLRALQDGELDIALLEEAIPPSRAQGWEQTPLMQDELVLIAPPGHPWARRGVVELEELDSEVYILRQKGSATRQSVVECLAQAGFNHDRLEARFELGHTEGIKRAVMAGLGVGFVSRYAIRAELGAGLLAEVPVRGIKFERSLWMLTSTTTLTPPMRRLTELLQSAQWIPEEPVRAQA